MKTALFSLIISIACATVLYGQDADLTLENTFFTAASDQRVEAQVGQINVPEYRANPNSNTISIKFIRLKSTTGGAGTPLIYLEGGPGASCTWQAEDPGTLDNWLPILQQRDVILLDQRGTGADAQRMTWINMEPIPDNVLLTEEDATTYFDYMATQAVPTWEQAGIDLRGYTSLESAHDIDDLRQALGLDRLVIMGFSYGTHLGLSYIKTYEERVERAILIGVEGLNETYKLPLRMDAAFHRLATMAANDPLVGQDVPDLVELYQRVSQKLLEEPAEISLTNLLSGQQETRLVGKWGLDMILSRDIGDATDLPVFPRLLHTIDQGDFSLLQWFVQKRYIGLFGLNAMSSTMDISSGASLSRLTQVGTEATQSMFGNVLNTGLSMRNAWPEVDLGDGFRTPFSSDVPMLLLSGDLDCNTPPHQAEFLRWHMPNARHLIVENAGHEQILPHPDIQQAVVDFLLGEDVSQVRAAYPPLRFIPLEGEATDLYHPCLDQE
ncbi:MAG: alpha/beta hydrolase [Bacteroidota bacterium]